MQMRRLRLRSARGSPSHLITQLAPLSSCCGMRAQYLSLHTDQLGGDSALLLRPDSRVLVMVVRYSERSLWSSKPSIAAAVLAGAGAEAGAGAGAGARWNRLAVARPSRQKLRNPHNKKQQKPPTRPSRKAFYARFIFATPRAPRPAPLSPHPATQGTMTRPIEDSRVFALSYKRYKHKFIFCQKI